MNSDKNHDNNFWGDERGGITIPSALVIYGMAVLICFVVKTGYDADQKLETQNAADAMAYSSGVVMARGMNAVSAINHALGELTAICVLLEALGGPEADDPGSVPKYKNDKYAYSKTEFEYNKFLDSNKNAAAPFPGIKQIDKKATEKAVEFLINTPSERNAFASVYDADLMLKYYAARCLRVKNILSLIGDVVNWIPAVGQAVSAVLSGLCVAVTVVLFFEIIYERVYILALDKIAGPLAKIKKPIRETVIPLLAEQGRKYLGKGTSNPMSGGLHKIQNQLKDDYGLTAHAIFPPTSKLRLPIMNEPPPLKQGAIGSDGFKWMTPNVSPWKGSDKDTSQALKILENIDKSIDKVRNYMKPFAFVAKGLSTVVGWFSGGSETVFDKLCAAIDKPLDKPESKGFADSPSMKSLETFYVDHEMHSQWVRATNPYVDSLRSNIRGWHVNLAPNSNLSSFYTHWSYRYTLNESFKIRSGQYSGKAPEMLVMDDFDQQKKGDEPWTRDAKSIDQKFSFLVAVKSSQHYSGIGDHMFVRPVKDGDVAFAQVLIYSGGGRDLLTQRKEKDSQPNTGWDTLQWEMSPYVKAPEWIAQASGRKGSAFFTQLLSGIKLNERSKVKLNWQAKLSPITKDQLELMGRENECRKDKSIGKSLDFMKEHHNILNH